MNRKKFYRSTAVLIMSALLLSVAAYFTLVTRAANPQRNVLTQEPLPRDFEEKAKQRFDKIVKPEITFQQYLEFEKQEFQRIAQLQRNSRFRYLPSVQQMTACGNGDFETALNSAEWQGGHGTVASNGDPNFGSFTAGIFPGPINLGTSHQDWVPTGTDPNVGIPLTGPDSAGNITSHAVRIGNTAVNKGSELLSKTFVVPAGPQSLIRFWYAVVFQDPGHLPYEQPSFWVRVTESSNPNVEIPGVVNLGNGASKLVSDGNNPFFQKSPTGLLFKNWSCAQIDLSQYVGKTVTIQFVTEDCSQGAHFGYAYIDNFCGNCEGTPDGNIAFDANASSDCGRGKLCFNYSLPKIGGTTGNVTVSLGIYQNGALLTTLTSPLLNSGSSYCFIIDPLTISGINTSLGAFDYVATGTFTIGNTTLAPKSVGTVPDGQLAGINNDYKIVCGPNLCCPGRNLVRNGDFESGNAAFNSQYTFNNTTTTGATLPGQYNIVNGAQASAISTNWAAYDHTTCNANSGKFMVVNGKTTQPANSKSTIWRQTVSVTGGREYRFCANVKNLPQCTFDIKPNIEVKFTGQPNNVAIPGVTPTVVNVPSGSGNECAWQLISASVFVPNGVNNLTVDILLDESGLGDGNDLALDDISLQQKSAINPNYLLVNFSATHIGSGKYNVKADYPTGFPSTGYGYWWEACVWDAINNVWICVQNPSVWWTYPNSNNFEGYVGTSTLSGNNPGEFLIGKRYRITFGAWSDCVTWGASSWIFEFNSSLKKVEFRQLNQPSQIATPPLGARGGARTGQVQQPQRN